MKHKTLKVLCLLAILLAIQFCFATLYVFSMYEPVTEVSVEKIVDKPYPVVFETIKEVPVEVIKETQVEVEKVVVKTETIFQPVYFTPSGEPMTDCIRVDSKSGTTIDCGEEVFRWEK